MPSITWQRIKTMILSTLGSPATTTGLIVLCLITVYCTSSVTADYSLYDFQCFRGDEPDHSQSFLKEKFKGIIGLQVSPRATHQLISRIFSIFLREILGYKNIALVDLEFDQNETREQFKLYKTLESLAARSGTWPIPVIDLEVWMYPDYHALPTEISEAGLVTNPGRFGWFVPQQLLDTDLNNTQLVQMLHYTALQDPSNEYYDNFVVDDDVINILEDKFGIERRFIPEHCNQSLPKNRCITIFSEYYSDTAFAEKHINELNFYTNILWIGKNYTNAVAWLFDHYKNEYKKIKKKKFILLHWTPSNIIDAEIDFESITMPRCETIEGDDESLCKYELTPLLKYYNSAVQFRGIFKAFYALEAFQIHGNELKKLLIETNRATTANSTRTKSHVYDEVACNWLKNTKVDNYTNVYKKWILTTSGDITIGGIFPITENNEAYRGITLAAEQAANAVKRSKILPGYKITLQNNDGKCRSDTAMKAFIHCSYIVTPLIGVLGPACSEAAEPIAGISKYLGMVVISYAAEGSTFTDRQSYPYFFRTIGSNRQYEIVYLKLLQQLKWRRIAALTEDGQKYTEYISHMENLLKQNNMELVINKKFPKDISVVEMKSHLLDLKKKNAKIIIADVNNENAQLVICEAHHLKMTAENGYVWFLPFWLSKRWVNETYPNGKHPNCTYENYKKVINGHFALNHAPFASNESIMQENKTVGQWLQEYTQTRGYISNYAGFAYDAVWVYALAASKLLKEDPSALYDLRDTHVLNKLIDIIWKTDFQGVSGRIRFDDGGSRISDINIMQWINGSYHQIGKYTPEIQEKDYTITGGSLELNEKLIVWLSRNGKPKDGTFVCGMAPLAEYLKTDCENVTFILITTMCLAFVILVSLASFMFWKRQYNRKLKHSAKVMRNFGIDLLSPSMSKNNTLDKWEVPKENVVINRRLGEGAFGTVYGGEAQFTEGEWTAVAVKTLKMGASTEDRLDFLSEAEAMKRFDHKNIVKLLGVCLQTEPIYTIMEFMLYGDLKTFLLARRHLVNEKITDDSDISSKRLTMMALDIARGLSYLADQKYVHRDMACRNCLVNAQRVVKLGDFGMARPMFDNDYYRFNRKGMLPVRWMAPESLGLGLFTPSSDVWSFGILLYEIITFGSFPYQGLTNNQVLDHIKNGKTLQVPVGVKPHLDGLMRACWNIEYKKRPTASEIVEYISNYPRLLSPCLDVPLSSVQIPETESDQLELLPGLRRRNKTQPNLDILARASNINNFDQKCDNERSESSTYENNINIDVLNVPPDSVSNDEVTISAYSPMSPLLKISNEVTKSNLSLKRYVPMYSSTTKPNQVFDSSSTIRLESTPNTEF